MAAPKAALTSTSAAVGGTWVSLGPDPIKGDRYIDTTSNVNSNYDKVSGRITGVVTDPTNPAVVYVGAAGGGVWKSSDSGLHWTALTDGLALQVGALAIDAQGQRIYAGTGEGNDSFDSVTPSLGVMVSSDRGASWLIPPGSASALGGRHIEQLAVDQSTSGASERIFAATDSGLFVSTDSGNSWSQNSPIIGATLNMSFSYGGSVSGGVTAIVQDPNAPATWVAAPADFCSTEAGNLVATTNNGASWSDIYDFPSAPVAARIAIGMGASHTAYASAADCVQGEGGQPVVGGNLGELAKGGTTLGSWHAIWTEKSPTMAFPSGLNNYFNFDALTEPPVSAGQGDYDNVVAVDPSNANQAVFGGVNMLVTSNGGTSFTNVSRSYANGVVHPDFHALAFTRSQTFFVGSDGGVWKTTNLGGTGQLSDWTNLNRGLNISQFFAGSALDGRRLLGGAQDNGSPGMLAGSPATSVKLPAWQEYNGSDGGYTAIDPGSSTIYAEFPFLEMLKGSSTVDPNSTTSPYDSFQVASPCSPSHLSDAPCNEFAGFVAPFLMDPTNASRLLAATNKVYITTTGGVPAGLTSSGGSWSATTSSDQTAGNGDFIASMTMGSSAGTANTVMTGSYQGRVWRTGDITNAANWTNITANLPAYASVNHLIGVPWISGLAFNQSNVNEAWVSVGQLGSAGRVWHTTTANSCSGSCWTDISSGMPGTMPVTSLAVDPSDPNIVYAGTYYGALVCTTCGGNSPTPNWTQLGNGLPGAWIYNLTLAQDGKHLIAWTHGRGAWEIPILSTTSSGVTASTLSAFGPQTDGSASDAHTVTVTNADAAQSAMLGGASVGGASPNDFQIVADNCSYTVLAPSGTCTLGVKFTPTASGARSATLSIPHDSAGSPATVPLAGSGTDESFYFAEGYTGFSETISMLLPNQNGQATITYYLVGGSPVVVTRSLTAGRVFVENVNNDVPANSQVSAKVTLTASGVAERALHFNTGTWHGSTDKVGVNAANTEWDFAEGSTLASFSEYLTLQNPDPVNSANVTLNYFTDGGAHPARTLSLPAASRTTVEVFRGDVTTPAIASCTPNGSGGNCGIGPNVGGVSTQVLSDRPIIAERPFYVNGWNPGFGTAIRDGHDAFGANGAGTSWYFAEGTTLSSFHEYLTLQNPNTQPAPLQLLYVASGQTYLRTLTLPAQSRTTVEVWKGSLAGSVLNCTPNGSGASCGVGGGIGGVSVHVVSTGGTPQPIVAERPMYMLFGGNVSGAHVVVGATGTGQTFGFAASSTLSGESDYLTIQNQNVDPALLGVTYYPPTGPALVQVFQVPGQTRQTVEVPKTLQGAGPNLSPLGIVLQSDQSILVERPTYNSTAGAYGATDTLGYPAASF